MGLIENITPDHVLCHFIWDLILAINSVFTSDGVWGCGGDNQLQTLHTWFPQVLRKKQLHGVPISFLLVAAVSLQSLPQPGHWRGAWKYGDAGPGPLCFILQEAVNRYKTRLLRYVGFRRTLHLLEAIQPRWPTQRTATVPGWKNQMC